jgi:general nucleoside transport system permease protein
MAPFRLAALLVSLVVAVVVLQVVLGSSEDVNGRIWRATLGSPIGLTNTLELTTPLLLLGLAVAIPYRLKLWNVGAEGQLFVGAWAGAAVAFLASDWPGPVLMIVVLTVSAAGGAAWMLVPALLRAYLGVREVITTLMLNFVALLWTSYWLTGPWVPDLYAGGVLTSDPVPSQARLPIIHVGDVSFHLGLPLAGLLAILAFVVFQRTKLGYECAILGGSTHAAAYTGIPVQRRMLQAMLAGGAFAGLAGGVSMLGNVGAFSTSLSNNSGYVAIAVAVLAGGSMLGVAFFATALAAVTTAGLGLRLVGISTNAVFALTGLMLLLAVGGEALSRYRLVVRSNR